MLIVCLLILITFLSIAGQSTVNNQRNQVDCLNQEPSATTDAIEKVDGSTMLTRVSSNPGTLQRCKIRASFREMSTANRKRRHEINKNVFNLIDQLYNNNSNATRLVESPQTAAEIAGAALKNTHKGRGDEVVTFDLDSWLADRGQNPEGPCQKSEVSHDDSSIHDMREDEGLFTINHTETAAHVHREDKIYPFATRFHGNHQPFLSHAQQLYSRVPIRGSYQYKTSSLV